MAAIGKREAREAAGRGRRQSCASNPEVSDNEDGGGGDAKDAEEEKRVDVVNGRVANDDE